MLKCAIEGHINHDDRWLQYSERRSRIPPIYHLSLPTLICSKLWFSFYLNFICSWFIFYEAKCHIRTHTQVNAHKIDEDRGMQKSFQRKYTEAMRLQYIGKFEMKFLARKIQQTNERSKSFWGILNIIIIISSVAYAIWFMCKQSLLLYTSVCSTVNLNWIFHNEVDAEQHAFHLAWQVYFAGLEQCHQSTAIFTLSL